LILTNKKTSSHERDEVLLAVPPYLNIRRYTYIPLQPLTQAYGGSSSPARRLGSIKSNLESISALKPSSLKATCYLLFLFIALGFELSLLYIMAFDLSIYTSFCYCTVECKGWK